MTYHFFFNTNRVGGAERSMVDTIRSLPHNISIHCYVPIIDQHHELKDFIKKELPHAELKNCHLYKSYYQMSRKGRAWWGIFLALPSLFLSMLSLRRYNFSSSDLVWLNGNKIAVVVVLTLVLRGFRGRILWHLRDYFPHSGLMLKVIKFAKNLKLEFVANSKSVAEDLKTKLKRPCFVLYNRAPQIVMQEKKFQGIMAFASMLAPWKGIHDALWMCSFREDELAQLGYREIRVYGENIYQTSGDHQGYKEQLENISKRFKKLKVEFCGLKDPHEIFQQIDVLVHSSIAPEPFGRIIVEAMAYGVAVLSTGLGGAQELVQHEQAWQYYPSHLHTFYSHLKEIVEQDKRMAKKEKAYDFVRKLDAITVAQQKEILHDLLS